MAMGLVPPLGVMVAMPCIVADGIVTDRLVAADIMRGVMADGVMAVVAALPIVIAVAGIVLVRVVEGAKEVYGRDADAENGEGDIDSLEGNHDRIRV
jgi:hypothetical protein